MREWLQRLRDWFRRERLDAELAEEIAFHKRQLARDAVHGGLGAEEAEAQANRTFGNTTGTREAARERWSLPALSHLVRDTRFALRGLRRSPSFTLTVILTLGLGIGANAAMFDVVDRLMFRPLAYLRDPSTVQRVYWRWTDRDRVVTAQSGPYTRYLDLRRLTASFEQLAAFSERNLAVGEGADARELRVAAVSASYFSFFDAVPVRGRFFVEAEDQTPRGAAVVVLSHALWQSQFGGGDVLGEMLQVGKVRAEIIGVAPRGFAGVNDAVPPMAWIPITTFAGSEGTNDALTYYTRHSWGWMHILARLKPGVTSAQASADASAAFRQSWLAAESVGDAGLSAATAAPFAVVGAVRTSAGPDPSLESRTTLWVSAVAVLVLLLAIANVANLFVARALRRRRETAVRVALGASRSRLLVQSMIEGAVLALVSAVAATLVARWTSALIREVLLGASASGPVFALPSVREDLRTIGVAFALAAVISVIVGAMPAVFVERGDLSGSLREGSRGAGVRARGLRAGLLVVQGLLSTVLLIGAVLFTRSLAEVRAMRLGYDSQQVLLITRVLRGPFPGTDALRAMSDDLLREAAAMPEVESAAWVASAPFISTSSTSLFVAGIDSVDRLGEFTFQVTTPDYFRTMGTRILRGRGIDSLDHAGAPGVAVVSESMARVLWPGREAIGECFRMRADTMPCLTVVGIAEDVVLNEINGTERLHYYFPLAQSTRTLGNSMLIKLRGDPAQRSEAVRLRLQRVLGADAYLVARPLAEVVSGAQRAWRIGATMFSIFAVLALIVAAVGLYGVIAYNVEQRRHELGVRLALGATQADLVRLVVAQSVRLVVFGVAGGLGVALLTARWIEPLLFRQPSVDPAVYAMVALVMLGVALAASFTPARRAATADPAAALRTD